MAYFIPTAAEHVAPAEVAEVDLYHPKSFVTKYIFSQDGEHSPYDPGQLVRQRHDDPIPVSARKKRP